MPRIINIIGITDTKVAPVTGRFLADGKGQAVIITASESRARRIAQDLAFYSDAHVYVLPENEGELIRYEAHSRDSEMQRLVSYTALAEGEKCIIVSAASGALKKLPPEEVLFKDAIKLASGSEFERDELIRRLSAMGYERTELAEAVGQFAVRGDIIDVYTPGKDEPFRIEFFDSEIDSLRLFDHLSQRSIINVSEIEIGPARILLYDFDAFERAKVKINSDKRIEDEQKKFLTECIDERINFEYLENFMEYFYPEDNFVWDYMKDGIILVDDPSRIEDEWKNNNIEFSRVFNPEFNGDIYYCTPFLQQIKSAPVQDEIINMETRQVPVYGGQMEIFANDLKHFTADGYKVNLVCSSQDRIINLKEFISRYNLENKIEISQGNISSGIEFPEDKVIYISEHDIFPGRAYRHSKKGKNRAIKAFTDIKKGDYVVHEAHGVGKFIGVQKMDIQGSIRDYLRIEYAGSDVLFVPVDQMESIQKYVGSDGVEPKVYSLNGDSWEKTKSRVKSAIKDMAEEFLRLSAERQMSPGFAFGEDSAWQKEFEEKFPYAETDDQLRCVEEIKNDMQQPSAMDRLLCGDVGYGKTEVACRAIFKCLEQGKQAAVLVPTTILANQHYHNFKDRFSDYPFEIQMLSRFRTPAQQDKIVRDIENGEVDLIVGTHRLLSGDVKFKDLGLLVVDEEQRFGVEHKEAIKKLKSNIDVLTLSATPIPRTLHMSLLGIRNMSVIEQPPQDRYPVQTYVMEQDDKLLADAIHRELSRGGQVFVVYNRVRGIQAVARKIQELVPEAKISVGHGQMGEHQLEDVMMEFSSGESDILIATTIIESGLDIPNVNTMIILDADHFGLSQLYQLRGRVGRSNRIAYAYLMYRKDKSLSEIAEKRLKAIREFTEFGSGFRVAMRDLELRGAGNILGIEQSGHMVQIGYELYCKLVDEAVRELNGEEPDEPLEDTSVELGIPAFIPETYIEDEITRLDMYKRISSIRDKDDKSEVLDELTDRFGDPPQQTLNLIEIAYTRNLASRCGVLKVVAQQTKIVFVFDEKHSVLSPEVFAHLVDLYGSKLTIYGGREPRISLHVGKGNTPEEAQKFIIAMMTA